VMRFGVSILLGGFSCLLVVALLSAVEMSCGIASRCIEVMGSALGRDVLIFLRELLGGFPVGRVVRFRWYMWLR